MPHHMIWDGWSFDLFYEEMAALYDAYRASQAPTPPPLAVDYARFLGLAARMDEGPDPRAAAEHWRIQACRRARRRSTCRPTGRGRATQSGDGATAWLKLPTRDRRSAARARPARGRDTLHDAAVGVGTAAAPAERSERIDGRARRCAAAICPSSRPVMGFFVNALPLRLGVDRSGQFPRACCARSAPKWSRRSNYQDVPFEHLVRVLERARDESRFPIYQAFFSYQDARQRPSRWGNLRHENVPVFQPAAAQDLALWFLDGADGLVGGLNYNTDIFDAGTAEQLGARFSAMLEALVRPAAPVRELLALSAARDRLSCARWNDTAVPLPAGASILRYIALERARTRTGSRSLCGDDARQLRRARRRALAGSPRRCANVESARRRGRVAPRPLAANGCRAARRSGSGRDLPAARSGISAGTSGIHAGGLRREAADQRS